ncbi:Tudor domain-containing protein 1, partial [Dryobates pubescens]
EKPMKLKYSSQNIFSIGYNNDFFRSLKAVPQMKTCHHCGLPGSRRCSRCKQINYCSTDCQRKDWPAHRFVCTTIKDKLASTALSHTLISLKTQLCCFRRATCKVFCCVTVQKHCFLLEKHIEKVMLSDLQTLGIKKAMEVQGKVTEFESPSEFYVQMSSLEALDQMTKLALKLRGYYRNAVIQEHYNAVKGEVCVVRWSLDQSWRRALIKDVDIVQKKAQVFYIDYGNKENIPLSWIKALYKDAALLFPPCVIKCSFANYDPKEYNEAITNFSSHLKGKYCSVTVVDILQEEMMLSFAVDVVFPDLVLFHCLVVLFVVGCFQCTASENCSKGSKEKIPEGKECLDCAISEAECISVHVGDIFSGMVSCIQSPENFFCQQTQSARQLAELQRSLNQHCEKLPSSTTFCPAAGTVCCAQFTVDNVWYRAAVIAYVSEDTVTALYIDYGNSEVLPLSRLRPMIPSLMALPAQAISCTLAGIKPPSEGWTTNAVSWMNQLVKNKVFAIKVVGKDDSRSVVELIDASAISAIDISSFLSEEGCAAEKSRMAVPAIGMADVKPANDKRNKRMYDWIKLSLKQTVDVIVCTVYNPGEFYCHISNNDELLALNALNKSLSEYCQKTPPNVCKPENGEPCCAFYSADGNWYRALVQNTASQGNVQVQFVDYGNSEQVPLDKIRQISPSFLTLPFQGIKCWLSGIKPSNGKWIPEATARFHTCTSGIKLQATVNSFSRHGAGVELIDNSTGHPKVINEILTSEKLAVKETLKGKNKLPKKPFDKKVLHCLLCFLLETSLGHWKLIELVIDETLPVRVTEVVGPDLFYAVPVQSKVEEELHEQLTQLEDYCKSCRSQSFRPKLGEACCAKFSGNGRWYRALVLNVSQFLVKVLYVDHGSTATLPFSKVLPITDSYLKLPFQTITCSLAGIEKADWSPSLLDKLKEMLLNKCVKITMKGTNGNANLVTVEKHCENGILDVADKLVMEGLVKTCSAENLPAKCHSSGGEAECCCAELKVELKKYKKVLLFILNKYWNPDGLSEMKKLLEN